MSDYLSDEEQMDALKQWWQSNGTLLVVGIIVVLAAVIGWRYYQSYVEEQVAASSDLYEAYLAEAADSSARTDIADELGERFPGSSYHSFALLHEAKTAIAADDLGRAEELLSTVAAQANDTSVKDLALLRKARILQQLEKTDAALDALAQVKGEGFRSQVAEIRGDLHVIGGERQAAFDAYSAALAAVENTAERPLLKMKVENTAPPQVGAAAQGALEEALEETGDTIEAIAEELPEAATDGLEEVLEEAVEDGLEEGIELEAGALDAIDAVADDIENLPVEENTDG